MSSEQVKGDSNAALEFFKRWAPDGPWVINAIDPERKARLIAQTFYPKHTKECLAFIEQWNGKRNLYFLVNAPRHDMATKADKTEIGWCVAFHVDVDPAKGTDIAVERKRIMEALGAYKPKPSVILFSGGGYQAFWLLREPLDIDPPTEDNKHPWARWEAYNRRFEKDLGGDHCFNIDRIMRLPGTVNLPDAKKRAAGRVPTLATVVVADWQAVYEPEQFVPWEEPAKGSKGKAAGKRSPKPTADKGDLPEWVQRVLENGPDHEGKHSYGGDRSKAMWAVCCALVRADWTEDEIYAAITNKEHKLSQHVYDQSDPEKYARRQVEKAWEQSGGDFVHNGKGGIITSQHNIRLALAKLGVVLSYDEFARRMLVEGPEGMPVRALDDDTRDQLFLMVDEEFNFRPSNEYFKMVVENEARARGFHPVRMYLDKLRWDGTPRLDTWLIEYAGAPDTAFTRAISRIMLIAGVRRVRQPGCKFDEIVVFISGQGLDKSTALACLAVHDDWFTDSMPLNATDKVAIEMLTGKWIVEVAELKGMRAATMEHLKAFLSRQIDRARLSYGRLTTEVPRQSIMWATTNSEAFLKDLSGNRRFWPCPISKFNVPGLRKVRDQLWAEAATREAEGVSIRLPPELYEEAGKAQEERMVEEPWVDLFADALGPYEYGKLLASDAWHIVNVAEQHRTQSHNERLGDALRKCGWLRKKLRFDGRMSWCYVKGDPDQYLLYRVCAERDVNGQLEVYGWHTSDPHPKSGRAESEGATVKVNGVAANTEEIPF